MNSIIEETVVPAMKHMDLPYYWGVHDSSIMTPMRFHDTLFLISTHADEESKVVVVSSQLPVNVPKARWPACALKLAQINADLMFVTFSMLHSVVAVDVCIEVNEVSDLEYHISRAFCRLCAALEDEYPGILRVVKPSRSQRPSRLERDVHEILGEMGM